MPNSEEYSSEFGSFPEDESYYHIEDESEYSSEQESEQASEQESEQESESIEESNGETLQEVVVDTSRIENQLQGIVHVEFGIMILLIIILLASFVNKLMR